MQTSDPATDIVLPDGVRLTPAEWVAGATRALQKSLAWTEGIAAILGVPIEDVPGQPDLGDRVEGAVRHLVGETAAQRSVLGRLADGIGMNAPHLADLLNAVAGAEDPDALAWGPYLARHDDDVRAVLRESVLGFVYFGIAARENITVNCPAHGIARVPGHQRERVEREAAPLLALLGQAAVAPDPDRSVRVGAAAVRAVATVADERLASDPGHWGLNPQTSAWLRTFADGLERDFVTLPGDTEADQAAGALWIAAREANWAWARQPADAGLNAGTGEWLGRMANAARDGGLASDIAVILGRRS